MNSYFRNLRCLPMSPNDIGAMECTYLFKHIELRRRMIVKFPKKQTIFRFGHSETDSKNNEYVWPAVRFNTFLVIKIGSVSR